MSAQRTPRPATDDQPIDVGILDWNPLDSGYVQVSNYFMRFWWPYLGTPAANLYLQLLVYSRPGAEASYPSLASLSRTLGVDRRSFYGRQRGDRSVPGAIQQLEDAGLLAVFLSTTGPRWRFMIQRRPGLLTDDQVATLPYPIQRAHAEWIERHVPNIRAMAAATPPVAAATPPVAAATRTRRTTITTQQRDIMGDDESARVGVGELRPATTQDFGTQSTLYAEVDDSGDATPRVPHALATAWEMARCMLPRADSDKLISVHPIDLADGVLTVVAPLHLHAPLRGALGDAIRRNSHLALRRILPVTLTDAHRLPRRYQP